MSNFNFFQTFFVVQKKFQFIFRLTIYGQTYVLLISPLDRVNKIEHSIKFSFHLKLVNYCEINFIGQIEFYHATNILNLI